MLPGSVKRRVTGMCACSATHSESKPRASSAAANSPGAIEYSVKKIAAPMSMSRPPPRLSRLILGPCRRRLKRLVLCEIRRQFADLRRRHPQAELAAAPQHVVGIAGPFALDEPAQFGFVEALAEAVTKILSA